LLPGLARLATAQVMEEPPPALEEGSYVYGCDLASWPRNYQIPVSDVSWFDRDFCVRHNHCCVDALARAYYSNDQRIEWTGQEATFGVEAVLAGAVHRQVGLWETAVWGEFYLNQPFDRNLLADTPERRSYLSNFDIDIFEISQLFLTARRGDLMFALGKMVTPFGRAYYPQYENSRQDGPFIRTESILWRETGFVIQYDPGILVLTSGVMNGGDDRDANSSKALLARLGVDTGNFVAGASIKYQDGIGSEGQKSFNNHVGLDVMCRRGICTLSAEVIYDQYGIRRPGFDPDDIFWRHDIYYRQQNEGLYDPITGVGYYVNLDINLDRWTWMLNYGEFYPEHIGDPKHDVTNRRGIIKLIHHTRANVEAYGMLLVENSPPVPVQADRERTPWAVLFGFQFGI
jgi:hypothetical protein